MSTLFVPIELNLCFITLCPVYLIVKREKIHSMSKKIIFAVAATEAAAAAVVVAVAAAGAVADDVIVIVAKS